MPVTAPPSIAIAEPRGFTEADVQAIERAAGEAEQINCPVTHHFGPGVYIREVFLPAGTAVIGHSHRHAHLNVMLSGRLTIIGMDGTTRELTAPQTFIAAPGRKIAYVHEDVRWQNIYATPETDIETLEDALFEKSESFRLGQQARQALLGYDKSADRADYAAAIAEHGFDPETVQAIVDNDADLIPFPAGSYKVMLATSPIHGRGLFATGNIASGEVIAPARIDGKRTPAGRYINHAREPNAAMERRGGDIVCVATRAIRGCDGGTLGEEVTIDYRRALELAK